MALVCDIKIACLLKATLKKIGLTTMRIPPMLPNFLLWYADKQLMLSNLGPSSINCNNAFVHGEPDEQLYMPIPPDFFRQDPQLFANLINLYKDLNWTKLVCHIFPSFISLKTKGDYSSF